MSIVTVGIDLAKNVFAVHGINEAGKPALIKPSVARGKLLELIASMPPCTIGMEACSGAHHWARLFMEHGHTVRLMAPKFVAPYRLSVWQARQKRRSRCRCNLRGGAAPQHALCADQDSRTTRPALYPPGASGVH